MGIFFKITLTKHRNKYFDVNAFALGGGGRCKTYSIKVSPNLWLSLLRKTENSYLKKIGGNPWIIRTTKYRCAFWGTALSDHTNYTLYSSDRISINNISLHTQLLFNLNSKRYFQHIDDAASWQIFTCVTPIQWHHTLKSYWNLFLYFHINIFIQRNHANTNNQRTVLSVLVYVYL